MKSISPLRALFLLLAANAVSGFTGIHNYQSTSVNRAASASPAAPLTSLNIASPNMEADLLAAEQQLRSIELPKNARPSRNNKSYDDAVMEPLFFIEVGIGRVAMLLAVVLAANELTTGMSLPEQLASILG